MSMRIPRAFGAMPRIISGQSGQAYLAEPGLPSAGRGSVAVSIDTAPCPVQANVEPCSTTFVAGSGSNRPNAPGDAPCEGELSDWVVAGRRPLRDVYASCDFTIVDPDIPNSDLGVASCFRDVCSTAQGIAQGCNTMLTQTMAATNTFDFTGIALGDRCAAVAVYLQYSFLAAQSTAPTFRLLTQGFQTVLDGAVGRDVQLQMNSTCLTAELFFLFAREQGAGVVAPPIVFPTMPPWACVVAVTPPPAIEPPNPTCSVVVSGFPVGVGSLSVQIMGANSQKLPRLIGAINNSKLVA